MSNELKPIVMAPIKARSRLVVLGIIVGSIAALYLLLVLVGGMGWDGY